jgi:CRP-like cAMP-binding protein
MTAHDAVRDRLAGLPIFRNCTKKEIGQIASLATQVDVAEGTVLTEQGKRGGEFAIVLSGTASVRQDGQEVAVLDTGSHYGEMALLDNGPRTATIVATSPMRLAVVSPQEFDQLVERVPAVSRAIMRGLAQRLREVDARHQH